ncbi:Glucose/arabinose dehydrogenase, beta-propeller fold [Fodinibius roseus]|uniref:Glucose/arabinose dehydrogenase, beta-propeller fold n=1 Tax=Fodinibius roseus TaxID=1194090 RepID=A0A1M5IPR6_9BACT|nr:PQQ-dependent sugar dehydrogenase [Fodinibius roseus]SHG30287.1 Glucose/arabinose dehydrogenase, beta-propeller fold [Fodinibius roseus]
MRTCGRFFTVLTLALLWGCGGTDEVPSLESKAETYFTLDSTTVGVSTIASGLEVPWEITWGPDGWIWMSEQKGIVSKLNPRTGEMIEMLKLQDVYLRTTPGLLGMDIHPDQQNVPYIFLLYNTREGEEGERITLNLVRYTVGPDTLSEAEQLLEIPGGKGHNGSRLKISPGGKVMVATGEAGNEENAQDIRSLGGKILRLNVDGTVPEDNPFPGSPVWAWGFRNQQGLTYGDRGLLYTSEHGVATDDEINVIKEGRNYGWPDVEGFCDRADEQAFCADSSITEPLKAWTPTIAPAGIDYYGSANIPEWQHSLILSTLKDATLHVLPLSGEGTAIEGDRLYLEKVFGRLRDVTVSPSGDVYVATSNRDWKEQENFPMPKDDRILRLFKISEDEKIEGIKSLEEMVSDSLASFSENLSEGALIYQKHCASCHMPAGGGIHGTFPPLKGSSAVTGDKEALIRTVLTGKVEPAAEDDREYAESMPAFDFLSDSEIARILTYIRTELGNDVSEITPGEVEEVRNRLPEDEQ